MEYVKHQRVVELVAWNVDTALLRGLQDGLVPEYDANVYIQHKTYGETLVYFRAHQRHNHWYEVVKQLPVNITYDECLAMGGEAAAMLNEHIAEL